MASLLEEPGLKHKRFCLESSQRRKGEHAQEWCRRERMSSPRLGRAPTSGEAEDQAALRGRNSRQGGPEQLSEMIVCEDLRSARNGSSDRLREPRGHFLRYADYLASQHRDVYAAQIAQLTQQVGSRHLVHGEVVGLRVGQAIDVQIE
jgi:hypothetical protein